MPASDLALIDLVSVVRYGYLTPSRESPAPPQGYQLSFVVEAWAIVRTFMVFTFDTYKLTLVILRSYLPHFLNGKKAPGTKSTPRVGE